MCEREREGKGRERPEASAASSTASTAEMRAQHSVRQRGNNIAFSDRPSSVIDKSDSDIVVGVVLVLVAGTFLVIVLLLLLLLLLLRKEAITKLMSLGGVGSDSDTHTHRQTAHTLTHACTCMHSLLLYFAIHASHNDPTWQTTGAAAAASTSNNFK